MIFLGSSWVSTGPDGSKWCRNIFYLFFQNVFIGKNLAQVRVFLKVFSEPIGFPCPLCSAWILASVYQLTLGQSLRANYFVLQGCIADFIIVLSEMYSLYQFFPTFIPRYSFIHISFPHIITRRRALIHKILSSAFLS